MWHHIYVYIYIWSMWSSSVNKWMNDSLDSLSFNKQTLQIELEYFFWISRIFAISFIHSIPPVVSPDTLICCVHWSFIQKLNKHWTRYYDTMITNSKWRNGIIMHWLIYHMTCIYIHDLCTITWLWMILHECSCSEDFSSFYIHTHTSK